MTKVDYRYDECGLDNVILKDLAVIKDDMGEDVVFIPNVNQLHRQLLRAVSEKPTALVHKELKFIRTELGLTQAEMAKLMGRDAQTVGRWERGEVAVEQFADTIIRRLAIERLNLNDGPSIQQLVSWSVATSSQPPYVIDASDPADYKMVA